MTKIPARSHMSRFTAQDNPLIEKTVDSHMQRIVTEITSRMDPQCIFLRGSFGRGEGSVCIENGRPSFFSDYEIDVATASPFYRSLFARLSKKLTAELGVETSIRWVRPDFLTKSRVGPIPTGPASTTTSLYESRYGSKILYGQDIIGSGPAIDPRKIKPFSGYQLVLNRMAESLYYIPESANKNHDDLKRFYWINKMMLACAEALLVLWGQYHFSYRERGRRFAALVNDRLDFMNVKGSMLSDYVARATEFKLRPNRGLHLNSVQDSWRQVIIICDEVFHHLTEQILGFSFQHYHEYPEQFLQYATHTTNSYPRHQFMAMKLLDVYKYLRRHLWPRGLHLRYQISKAVYAAVPLMFVSWAGRKADLSRILTEVRNCLRKVSPLEPPQNDLWEEWEGMRQRILWAWKNFCYL